MRIFGICVRICQFCCYFWVKVPLLSDIMAYFIAFQKLDIMRVMMSNLQQYLIEKLRVHDIIELCNG